MSERIQISTHRFRLESTNQFGAYIIECDSIIRSNLANAVCLVSVSIVYFMFLHDKIITIRILLS